MLLRAMSFCLLLAFTVKFIKNIRMLNLGLANLKATTPEFTELKP